MPRTIEQTVTLPASPAELFDTYVDARKHGTMTGAPATISAKAGARFEAFGGALSGRNLLVVPKRMIVQAWRSSSWKKTDDDSVLVLLFSAVKGGGRITLVHANVPDADAAGVSQGWNKYYWTPWKAYLKSRKKTR